MKKIVVLSLFIFTPFIGVFASSGSPTVPQEKPVIEKPIVTPSQKPIKGLIILGDNYAIDTDAVYVVNTTRSGWTQIPNADRATFKVLGGQFARDIDDIFQMGKKIVGVDSGSFSIISGQHGYAQDDKHIYGPQGVILEADPETFKMLTKQYALDAGHVFFDGANIPEANSGSFRVIDSGLYAIDDQRVFYAGKILKNALPNGLVVKGPRAFSTNGFVFLEGKVEKGDVPTVEVPIQPDTPKTPDTPDIPQPVPPTEQVSNGQAWTLFWSKTLPYIPAFSGDNAPFWMLMGLSVFGLFSLLFVFFANRNDESVSLWKSIIKTLIAVAIMSIAVWILSLFLHPFTAIIAGIIIGFFFFITLWSALGWIKSFLITILTLISIIFFGALGYLILHAIFGDIAQVLAFINQPSIQLIGLMEMVGFFVGSWLIVTQLGTSLARALGQSFIATVVALMILSLLIWIMHIGVVLSVIFFCLLYCALLWIMRFRMVSNLFTETVRIVRVGLILAVVIGVVVWIVL